MSKVALHGGSLGLRVSSVAGALRLLRVAVVAAGLGVLIVATSSHAEKTRVFRVAVLLQERAPPVGTPPSPGGITKSLEELGYVEDHNVVFDRRFAAGDSTRFLAFAAEVVALKPDVIIAETTPGALAAKASTSTIPIVFFTVTDPVGTGLVSSIANSAGNVTGFTDAGSEAAVKGLEMLHEIVPGASRVAVLMSDNPVHALQLRELRKVAASMGIFLAPVVAARPDELDAAFASVRDSSGMIVLGGPPFSFGGSESAYRRLGEFQQKTRLPVVCSDDLCIQAGGLVGYWPVRPLKGVAGYVDKILRGARPRDLPVQQPTEFHVVLNTKAARQMGLAIPPALRLRATEIIE
jgi:putative ABC transport system substrate-binding protein